MFLPLVGERVWVSGSPHEFIVVRADYSTCIATISPAIDRSQLRRCPFRDLFPSEEFEAAQASPHASDATVDVLESSRGIVRSAMAAIDEMRKTTRFTSLTIKKSRELIAQTDRIVARWKSLGIK